MGAGFRVGSMRGAQGQRTDHIAWAGDKPCTGTVPRRTAAEWDHSLLIGRAVVTAREYPTRASDCATNGAGTSHDSDCLLYDESRTGHGMDLVELLEQAGSACKPML